MMQTDVKALRVTASGAVTDTRSRVKSVTMVGTGGAGNLKLRDGGASGTIRLELDVPASGDLSVLIPGEGVLFYNDVYAEVTALTAATIFYG